MEKKKIFTDEQIRVAKAIMKGNAYCKIDRVSASGMTRYMRVYLHNRYGMEHITYILNEVLGWGTDKNGNIKVGGCGMDMCMHLLYSYLGCINYKKYASKWSQRYNFI